MSLHHGLTELCNIHFTCFTRFVYSSLLPCNLPRRRRRTLQATCHRTDRTACVLSRETRETCALARETCGCNRGAKLGAGTILRRILCRDPPYVREEQALTFKQPLDYVLCESSSPAAVDSKAVGGCQTSMPDKLGRWPVLLIAIALALIIGAEVSAQVTSAAIAPSPSSRLALQLVWPLATTKTVQNNRRFSEFAGNTSILRLTGKTEGMKPQIQARASLNTWTEMCLQCY